MGSATSLGHALDQPLTEVESITVRQMGFEFNNEIPEFWFDGNPLMTMVMTAMSVSFPAGERFFIDSVRYYEKQIVDPNLKKQIKGFIGQEANHTLEHSAFNQFMDDLGYPAIAMENFVRDRIKSIQKRSAPERNLASTAALEHFTAILAGAILERLDVLKTMHPTVAKMWAWHAIEEIEHRSVAFDVYQDQVGDEKLRRSAMIRMTMLFVLVNVVRTFILMLNTRQFFNLKGWVKGIKMMWGKDGIYRRAVSHYFEYYRKDFHPSHIDYQTVLEEAKRLYINGEA